MKRFTISSLAWLVFIGGAMLIAFVQLPACHTVEGAGRDVSAAGEGIAGSAERHRHYD